MTDRLRNKKIAIVGTGYIGRNLLAHLERRKGESGISLQAFGRSNLKEIKGQAFDIVFNCSGNTGDFRTNLNETIESNLAIARFLTEEVEIRESLVLLSSTRIYGFTEDEGIFSEDSPVLQGSHLEIDFIYDGTKMLLESLANNLARPYRIVVCRLSNVYGRYSLNDLDDSTFLKVMLRHHIEKSAIRLRQNAASSKDYIFIDDAVEGLIAAAVNSKENMIFNIAAGKSYSIDDWIRFFNLEAEQTGNAPAVHSRISVEKAKKELGFSPRHTLENLSITQLFHP